jgi:hypothetical protein
MSKVVRKVAAESEGDLLDCGLRQSRQLPMLLET